MVAGEGGPLGSGGGGGGPLGSGGGGGGIGLIAIGAGLGPTEGALVPGDTFSRLPAE